MKLKFITFVKQNIVISNNHSYFRKEFISLIDKENIDIYSMFSNNSD